MSAFIVSKKHIDALLTYAREHAHGSRFYPRGTTLKVDLDPTSAADLTKVGQILVDENCRSFNSSYDEENKPEKYKFEPNRPPHAVSITPVRCIKACNCFDYQACETDDYETTAAHYIIDTIRRWAIRNLPGYENAAWEITDTGEQQ